MLKTTIAILTVITGFAWGLAAAPDDFNTRFINAARKAKNSVVNIVIYESNPADARQSLKKKAYASGTIISESGIVVTNYHVIIKGNYFQAVNSDGVTFELEKFEHGGYFLSDPKTDIALIKLSNTERIRLSPIDFADSSALQQGEWVIAIGNPYGLRQSITSGIVSYTGRDDIGFTDIEDFIQTDVPINPGNSGGPLVNLHGRMVGINTAISTVSGGYQGISFAIPSGIVQQVSRELLNHGRVRRGWLGFIAREKKTASGKITGIVVDSVIKGSPAEAAGLKRGDLIREMDSTSMTSLSGLIRVVSSKAVGAPLFIRISRDGVLKDYTLILREKKEYRALRSQLDALFNRYGIEIDENSDRKDVIVSYVSPRGLAYDLRRGDIIISLNGVNIFSLDDFARAFSMASRVIREMRVYRDSAIHTIEFTRARQ
jgi:serine protease Do